MNHDVVFLVTYWWKENLKLMRAEYDRMKLERRDANRRAINFVSRNFLTTYHKRVDQKDLDADENLVEILSEKMKEYDTEFVIHEETLKKLESILDHTRSCATK
jgi:hypothetical protein